VWSILQKANVATEMDFEFDADEVSAYNTALPASETSLPPTSNTTVALNAKQQHASVPLLLDGGANCTIFTSTAGMTNLRPADITIEVGGGSVHCKLIGDYNGYVLGQSKHANAPPSKLTIADARICAMPRLQSQHRC
jgi:hypothetical protein